MNTFRSIGLGLLFLTFLLRVEAGANFATAPPYYGQKYTDVPGPRGLFLDACGDILVLSRATSSIIALSESANEDGSVTVGQDRIVNGERLGLSHGLTHYGGYLYASSGTTVYRWPYVPGSRELVTADPDLVIVNLPAGGYETRTLVFDAEGRLYVSVGSLGNVDPNSERARILRFRDLAGTKLPLGGIDAKTGEVFADGLRNEVGLGFDGAGILWGVENGADQLRRADLGGDIHNGNPAEELNKFESQPVGAKYGYPYCFSSYNLKNYTQGTQFAWPTFMGDGVHTDQWCGIVSNNRPPVLAMPAHTAPLGIEFYRTCSKSVGAFPCEMTNDAFIAHHGSANSVARVGYKVTHLPTSNQGGPGFVPNGEILNVIYAADLETCEPSTCFRPVNAIFDKDGHLIVSVDSTGEIFRVYYSSQPPKITSSSVGRVTIAVGMIMAMFMLQRLFN